MANTKITSDNLDTLTTLTVDDITLDGSTISDAGDLTLDVGGDIILDAGGDDITFKSGGTEFGSIFKTSNDLFLNSAISDGDIKFRGNDGGSFITALTLDMSDAGAATFNAGVTATTGTFSGAVSASSVDASAGFLNGSNGGIRIHSGGTKFFNITAANAARDNHMDIGASDARFKGLYLGDKIFIGGLTVASNDAGRIGLNRNPDDGSSINSSSLQRFQINGPYSGGDYLDFQNYDSSGNYTGGFRVDGGNIQIGSTSKIMSVGDTDSYLQFNQADTLRAVIGDSTRLIIGTGETVFNEDIGDFNFRIESDDNANMFYLDAGKNQIFINGSTNRTESNFETTLSTSRHDQSQTSTNTVSGSGQYARYACGTQIVNSSGDVGTKLVIPMTSQVNLWRPVTLKLLGCTAEYNYAAGGNRAFEVCVAFSLLNSINNLTEINRSGNCSSVTADGMNLEINFTSAMDDGLSNYNGVMFHYEVLSITPEYVQIWNASFN